MKNARTNLFNQWFFAAVTLLIGNGVDFDQGSGWRITKALRVGDRLHGLSGGVPIEQIEPGEILKAYNLIVDETNTYFLRQQRILVHDNSPRQVM